MTPQEMKCMSKTYAKEHAKAVHGGDDATRSSGKVTLAHPLKYTKAGHHRRPQASTSPASRV